MIIWTRTGYAGSQRYPLTWGGDQESNFKGGQILIRAGINAGVCGFPYWAHDGGGFMPNRTKGYYVRSCQWSFLSPIGLILGSRDFSDPNSLGNEPWVFGLEAESVVRKYVRLRYRLIPYIYSYAVKAWETGLPIMRGMPLEFPGDPETYSCDYQYMLGRELLIAPVYEESRNADLSVTRKVYLPGGLWYDFSNDQVFHGPQEVTYPVPFERIPVFVRAGAVIPYGPDIDHIDGPPPAQLTLDIYPGADSSFDLLEDDGLTLALQERRDRENARGAPRGHKEWQQDDHRDAPRSERPLQRYARLASGYLPLPRCPLRCVGRSQRTDRRLWGKARKRFACYQAPGSQGENDCAGEFKKQLTLCESGGSDNGPV